MPENNVIKAYVEVEGTYETNYGKGILWFINEKNFLYSDIIIFSSEKLAKNSLDIKD